MSSSSLPSVAQYYAGKNVFLTGATGFVGKVLIEKLLRCCPDISAIYCLVRPKKGKTASDRVQEMLQQKCYDSLREQQQQQPSFASKVHAVSGDILEKGLGISTEDRVMLQQCIHVVIHCAATVRFTEHLRLAIQQNVLGVRMMLDLCRDLSQLEAYVHVSTAYANCSREYIEEKIYPPHIHPQKIIDAIDWMDDDALSALTPHILHSLPNTYTLSKQLGESILQEEGGELPIAVVRPSIMAGAWREPVPGWVDSFNGPSGLWIAYGKGLLHSLRGDTASVADFIPVDFTVNAIITAAWQLGTSYMEIGASEAALGTSYMESSASEAAPSDSIKHTPSSIDSTKQTPSSIDSINKQTPSSISSNTNIGPLPNHRENATLQVSCECQAAMNDHAKSSHESCQRPNLLNNGTQNGPHRPALHHRKQPIRVYHITSGQLNPYTWGELQHIITDYCQKYPLEEAWNRPTSKQILTKSSAFHYYRVLVSDLIPAYAADMLCTVIGRKPRMVNLYKRLHELMSTQEYFLGNSWHFTHRNTDQLRDAMSSHDQQVFYLDICKLHWPSYLEMSYMGTKKFVLKEELSNLHAAKAHQRKLRNLCYLFNTLLMVVVWRLLVARSKLAGSAWYLFMGLISKFVHFYRITSTQWSG